MPIKIVQPQDELGRNLAVVDPETGKLLESLLPDNFGNSVYAQMYKQANYNEFTEPGIYYISSYFGECLNAPDGYSYMVRVEKCEMSNFARIFQIANRFVDANDNDKQKIYIRNGFRETEGGDLIWNNWISLDSINSVNSVWMPIEQYATNALLSESYGNYQKLDDTNPIINYQNSFWNVTAIRLRAVSEDPDISGNVVLIPIVDGVELSPVTAEINEGSNTIEISFNPSVTGLFSLKRDCSNTNDTLKNDGVVSLLILNTQIKLSE